MSWHDGVREPSSTWILKFPRIMTGVTLERKTGTWVLQSLRLRPTDLRLKTGLCLLHICTEKLNTVGNKPSITQWFALGVSACKSPVSSACSLAISLYRPAHLLSELAIIIYVILPIEKVNSQHHWLNPLRVSFFLLTWIPNKYSWSAGTPRWWFRNPRLSPSCCLAIFVSCLSRLQLGEGAWRIMCWGTSLSHFTGSMMTVHPIFHRPRDSM